MGARIGEAPKFRVYLGKKTDGQSVILKVAKTFEDGDALAEEAGKFNTYHAAGEQIAKFEMEHRAMNSHYDWLFARLESSFMEPSQQDRRINVFSTPDVELSELVPLTKLQRETEIDTQTSVWILGRLFKFYSFFELMAEDDSSFANYPVFSPDNYLISPKKHRLIYYNYSGAIEDVWANDFVKATAKFILSWVIGRGGTDDMEYFELLRDFSEYGREEFEVAHGDLYAFVKECWGISYYPFTYRERGTDVWQTIKEG